LRFPEFTGEWKLYQLSDLVNRVTRRNKNTQTNRPLTISAQYGLVDQITFFNKKIASADMSNYYLLKKGEFAYNKSYSGDYPWGAVKRLDLYEDGALSSLYICFAPKAFVSSDFLVHYFETAKWYRGISEIAGEGARNHGLLNIAIDDYFRTRHYLAPTKAEQDKISSLFNLIEERIRTQKKVIERIETLINGLNQAVLNNHGVKTQLKHVLTEVVEKTSKLNQYDVLSSTAKGLFLQSEYFDKEVASIDNVGYKILRKGKIVISPQNLWLGNINYNDCFEVGMVSPSYKIFAINDHYNSLYISLLMRTHKAFFEYANASEQGASIVRRNLNMDDFYAISFHIPTRQEQDYVASAYQCLFRRKQVEQTYLSQLEIQKTYLLSQMFI
jgi:type I restriction enzyme S subunit